MRIRNRVLLIMESGLALTAVCFTLLVYNFQKHSLIQGVDRELLTAAYLAHDVLPKGYHDRIADKNSVSDAEYLEIVDRFNKICVQANLEYLWSLMLLDGKVVFTSGTSPGKDASKRDQASFLEAHSAPHLYTKTFETMIPQCQENKDKWGTIRAALVPFRDSHGRAYLVGASRSMAAVNAQMRETLLIAILSGAAFVLLGTVASVFLANSISHPVEAINKAAEGIARGELSQKLNLRGANELAQLAGSIETMSAAIQNRMKELAESREDLKITLNSIGDAVIATDEKGCVTRMNPVAEALTGWPAHEAQNKPLVEIFSIINALSRKTVENPVERVLREGRVVGLANHTVLISRQGTERQIADSAAPIRTEEGKVVGVVLVFRDVTEEYEKDMALRLSEEKFRSLFNSMSEGVALHEIVTDENGAAIDYRILDVNPAYEQNTGLHGNDARGQLASAFYEGGAPPYLGIYSDVADSGKPQEFEAYFEPLHRHFRIGVFSPGKGLFATVFEDITERKRVEKERRTFEAQVQQTQKLESLGVLAGGIAHDFNNLLTTILGNADLALSELSTASPARDNLKDIETASHRAADLCKQMLAYSGKGRFTIESLNLNHVVDEMSHMLEVSISKKAILKRNFAEAMPLIEADATQMRQVIMNLIINASEAIGNKSGVITISTGSMNCDRPYLNDIYLDENLPEGLYASLEVSDNGCGMSEATRKRIFDPFFTTKFTGRGLGLAAVLGIIRGHRGSIKVYSELGRGTTIKILLPAAAGDSALQQKNLQVKPQAWRGEGVVLLVDDEESVRTIGAKMFSHLGFTVCTAANGREAVEIFRQRSDEIVCVLLDLTMPHMDGAEAFTELRRIKSDVQVILSSGYSEQEVTDRFAGKGLASFIKKPYTLSALTEILRQVIEGKNNGKV